MSVELDIGREMERLAADLSQVRPDDVAPILALGNAVYPLLLDHLRHPDPNVRALAAALLGEIGNAKAIPALIRVFGFVNPPTALDYVRYALARLISPDQIEPLIEALHGDQPHIRAEVVRLLGELEGDHAFETILAALHDKHAGVRETAAQILGVRRDPRATQALVMKLLDYDEPVRMASSMALRQIGDPATPLLLRALQADDPAIQAYVAKALGRQGNVAAIEPLLHLYKHHADDAIPDVAHEAAYALAEIGEVSAIEPLLKVLVHVAQHELDDDGYSDMDADEPDPLGRLKAVAEILGGSMVEPLTDLLEHDQLVVQEAAIRVLGHLRDPRAVEWLLDKLESEDGSIRDAAIAALGQIGDRRAQRGLEKFLHDPNETRRALARVALLSINDSNNL